MSQVKKTMKIIRRSPYQALAAMLAMSLTFFVASIFIILILGGQVILNYIEQRPQIIAFFKDNTTDSKIQDIENQIKATGLTKDIKYVSKDEALAIYRERNKDDPVLLESVTADFLPASIDISVKRAEDIDNITNLVKNNSEVDKVVTPQNLVSQLVKWTNAIRVGGLIFVATLLAISFLIIIMVLGMRIAIRKEEISIMGLVGATKWYIAKPFFLEGMLYGVIGASLAILLIYALLLFYSPNIQNFLGPIEVFPISPYFFLILWAAEVTVASLVGIIGAAIALFRYLKIK